jgi:dolichol-phosphate mannosyltransferase
MKKLISIVVPMYNEAAGIGTFDELLRTSIKSLGHKLRFEILYVDDGSTDQTVERVKSITQKQTDTKLIALSKNYGKEIALTAGMDMAQGEAIISLDSDGQHPPKLLAEFINRWEGGADIVVGIRQAYSENQKIKALWSRLFYRLFNKISGVHLVPNSTDFRLTSREVVDRFLLITHHKRITRGLIDSLGYTTDYVSFQAPPRIAGQATYSTRQLLSLAGDTFISLSFVPLKIFLWLGAMISALSLCGGLFVLVEQYLINDPLNLNLTGSAQLGILILFMAGLMLVGQGISSIYISHIYLDSGNRPLYSISKRRSLL